MIAGGIDPGIAGNIDGRMGIIAIVGIAAFVAGEAGATLDVARAIDVVPSIEPARSIRRLLRPYTPATSWPSLTPAPVLRDGFDAWHAGSVGSRAG